MSYYGDSMSYYYGGAFANHSSLMTGVGRVHTPLRFAPHLSTISESPLSTYRRYSPMVLPARSKRIIDTADIDVSSPRNLHTNQSRPGNRLRRDRPTIRIRSQALKDNPALREHNARHEKTVGELLMEKFLIKDKKSESPKPRIYQQVSLETNLPDSTEAMQRKVTRRMTRRRSSADVQMDPGQLERELAIAQVQAEVLDTLVAEEQAEIEVETRRGTLLHKNPIRSVLMNKSESEEEKSEETKKKLQKKIKKRKKTTDKPSPPSPTVDKKEGKLFKIEASNSVGDFSTVLVNAKDDKNNEQFKESIKLQIPRKQLKQQKIVANEEEIVVVPIKKPYVHDNTRNSAYLTLRTQITKPTSDDEKLRTNEISLRFNKYSEEDDIATNIANIRSKDKQECDTEVMKSDAINDLDDVDKIKGTCETLGEITSVNDDLMKGCNGELKLERSFCDNIHNHVNINLNNEVVDHDSTNNKFTKHFDDHLVTVIHEESSSRKTDDESLNCDFNNYSSVVKKNEINNQEPSVDENFWDFRASGRKCTEVIGEEIGINSGENLNCEITKKEKVKKAIDEKYKALNTIESSGIESKTVPSTPESKLTDKSFKFLKSSSADSGIDSSKVETKEKGRLDKLKFITSEISSPSKPEIIEEKSTNKLKSSSAETEIISSNVEIKKKENLETLKPIRSEILPLSKPDVIENKSTNISKSSSTDSGISLISVLDPKKEVKPIITTDQLPDKSKSAEGEIPSITKTETKDIKKPLITSGSPSTDSEVSSPISPVEVEPRNSIKKPEDPSCEILTLSILKAEDKISTELDSSSNLTQVSSPGVERTEKVQKNLKLLSIDSGIGSVESDLRAPEKKIKKKLKNSKGSSFELDEDIKPKFSNQVDENSCKIGLTDKEKLLPVKRLKKKITSSKTLPLELSEKSQKDIVLTPLINEENSLKKIGEIPIKKSESTPLPPLKEDIKAEPEIDFWSEIPTAETPKIESPKLSLKSETDKTIKDEGKQIASISKPKKQKITKSTVKNVKPVKKVEKVIFENKLSSENSSVKNIESTDINKMKVLLTPVTKEKIFGNELSADGQNDENGGADSEPITPVLEVPPPLINVEAPVNIAKDSEESSDDDEDDESPKTPTNEHSIINLTKWNKSTDLTILDGNVPSSDAGNEVTAATKNSKKKQSRRKKSGNGYSVDTIIRKLPDERSTGGTNISDNNLLSSPYQTLPTRSPKSSPKVVTKRPNDLVKMFYTTPSSLLTATPRDLSKVKRNKVKKKKHSTRTPSASSDSTGSTRSSKSTVGSSNSTEVEDETEQKRISSTRSNDSGFDGSPRLSNCDMACHKKCEKLTGNLCGLNQKLVAEALQALKRAPSQSSDNQRNSDSSDHVQGSGRITPPATNLPRFKKYAVEDFHFLKVLGKGSFGKVLLAELRGTDCVYAVKCLKKDVVLEDDDVECTLIERKVLTLATRHPYLCHLFCTFQTDSHLFFVMEYLNGGDLMFHIQKSGRFPEFRARFYAAEIWSGLNFLHKKGIVYRDLKLDNVLLDFEGHIRIADFGMCKLQIFLDKTADTFCGTPDYMAPEIIKGLKYNQAVDWWSFGVLLYEMLTGQSPFSGCDEDELFWSICNERPFIPRYLSQESMDMLISLLEKDSGKRPMGHEIQAHAFFHSLSWDRLERRLLDPPFKPALDHTLDTRYFDTAFTAERPRLTPVPEQILTSMDQGVFRGFSYTNPNATD